MTLTQEEERICKRRWPKRVLRDPHGIAWMRKAFGALNPAAVEEYLDIQGGDPMWMAPEIMEEPPPPPPPPPKPPRVYRRYPRTPAEVEDQISRMRRQGELSRVIAEAVGISRRHVARVMARRREAGRG